MTTVAGPSIGRWSVGALDYDDWRQIRYVLADQAVEEELQLVRARTQNAAVLFPLADPTEIGDGEAVAIIREDDITPDAIRKIYEPPE